MKKIIITTCLAFSLALAHAQEAQIKALEAAVKSKTNIASALTNAESAIKGKLNTINPSLLVQYYLAKGKAELEQNNLSSVAEAFQEIKKISEDGYFEVKNKSTKNKEYYYSKQDLDKAIAGADYSKSKKKTIDNYDKVIGEILTKKIQTTSKKATDAYNKKDYLTASEYFVQTYQLQNAQGEANKDYLYYAAVAYQVGKKLDKAAPLYDQLIKDGYNGVKTTYYATSVANGERTNFPNKEMWDSYKKNPIYAKAYKDWKSETSKDISKDLYTYAATVNFSLKNYKRAAEIAREGIDKIGDNEALQNILSDSMYKSGDSKSYVEQLRKRVEQKPNDTNSMYNLGVMLSTEGASSDNLKEAQRLFKKVLSLDPNNTNAALNMAVIITRGDEAIVKKLRNLSGSSKEERAQFNGLLSERKALYKSALPYLEQVAKAKPDDLGILRNLRISYGVLGMDAKKAEIKKQIKSLELK